MNKTNEIKTKESEGEEIELEEIGTEILDSNLPSDINFGKGKPSFSDNPESERQIAPMYKFEESAEVEGYTIKGKGIFSVDPEYKKGDIIHKGITTFRVKAFNEERSNGLKKIWEAIVGYATRDLYIGNGYLYILEQTKPGFLTHHSYKVTQLFKLFIPDHNKIRLVFRSEQEKTQLLHREFTCSNIQDLVDKIKLEVNILGLEFTNEVK